MASYDYRQPVILQGAFASDSGAEDPDTITLRIKAPDGTEVTKAKSDLSTSGTGVWYYKYLPPSSGTFWYGFEWPNETAAQKSFYVIPPNV